MSTNTYAREYVNADGQRRVMTDAGDFSLTDIDNFLAEAPLQTDLAVYHPAGDGVTIDQETGEVIDNGPITFRTIVDAEHYIFGLAEGEEDIKLRQVRALMSVRDQKLYREKPDPEFTDGRVYKSFTRYLKDICGDLTAFSGDKKRTVQDYMAKVAIYERQLWRDDAWIRKMGYHATLMLQVAARDRKTLELLPEDEPVVINGQMVGKRLGMANFKVFVEEITDLVESGTWPTFSTKVRVHQILGKETREARWAVEAVQVGSDVVIKQVTFWCDESGYEVGDRIPLEEFALGTRSMDVSGLGENWRP